MSPTAKFDESKINRASDGKFGTILRGEILDASLFTARTGTDPVPVGDLVKTLDVANNQLQDFTEQYHGKAEWAAMKQSPEKMLAFAGLELAHADADFRLTEKFMATEVLRHAVAGENDSHDQKQHQDNLTIRLFEKQWNRLRKVRQFGGNAGVAKVIADSAADLEAMQISGAQDDDRCFLYYTASLAHAQLQYHDVNHQLHENRVPGEPVGSMASIKSMDLQATLADEMADTNRSIFTATRELFPYNQGL